MTTLPVAFDTTSTIAQLFVYPVKSCAGVAVQEAVLTDTGLDLDRAWMVVDAAGHFVSQRDLPRMALVQPQLKLSEMVLRAPGMLALHVAIDTVEEPVTVQVWKDTVQAYGMGAVAAQWFSDFLGQPLRLVRFDPDFRRLSSLDWTGGVEAPNQFSDGFPVLVASVASIDDLNQRLAAAGQGAVGIERFRPNVVLQGIDLARQLLVAVVGHDADLGVFQRHGITGVAVAHDAIQTDDFAGHLAARDLVAPVFGGDAGLEEARANGIQRGESFSVAEKRSAAFDLAPHGYHFVDALQLLFVEPHRHAKLTEIAVGAGDFDGERIHGAETSWLFEHIVLDERGRSASHSA